MAQYEGKLDEEMVVKLIYSFTRAFDHNPKIFESCYNYMIGNNFNQLSYMSILIKN
jgi:lysine-N-methylase